MKIKHTPGPWVRRKDIDNSPDIHICEESGGLIATCNAFISFNCLTQDSEEMKANARLIAAAPDLLAALEAAQNQRGDWLALVDAAILRAKGEA